MFFTPTILLLGATFGLVISADTRSESHVTATSPFGGTQGYDFTDLYYTDEADHKRMASIVMSGCGAHEHVSEMLIGFRDNHSNDNEPDFLSSVHGSPLKSQTTVKLAMAKDEYITEVAAWTYGSGASSMVGKLELHTSKGQKAVCGETSKGDAYYHFAPHDSALLFLSGRHDVALNSLQAHWIPIKDF